MLLNELFTISSIELNDDQIAASVRLNPEHPVFSGHFPGNPILPGVCTVEISRILIEKALVKQLMLTKAGNIKYLGFINPLNTPDVTFSLSFKTEVSTQIMCSVNVTAGDTTSCSFKAEYMIL